MVPLSMWGCVVKSALRLYLLVQVLAAFVIVIVRLVRFQDPYAMLHATCMDHDMLVYNRLRSLTEFS